MSIKKLFSRIREQSSAFQNVVANNTATIGIDTLKGGFGRNTELTSLMPYKVQEGQTLITMNLTGVPIVMGYSPYISKRDIKEVT
jgi:hypothetical protein